MYLDDISTGHIKCCQVCRSFDLQQVINLGFSAPCDSLLTHEMLNSPEKIYPLNLVRCRKCGLVQIDYAVNPSELFYSEYPYRSGITETLKKNLHKTAEHVVKTCALKSGSLVVDIGSNDGTVLEGFKMQGMRVLGVEPTNIANIAIENGIETINKFFSMGVAKEISEKHGDAAIITAANVFAHVSALSSFLKGVYELLNEDGLFVSESHYMLDILETLQYDSIYHEHLRFYLIKPLIELFEKSGFTLVNVERIPNYGGSIRVYAQKGLKRDVSSQVVELLALEEKLNAYEDKTYEEFSRKVQESRKNIRSLLVQLNNEGKKVIGIGCPGRAVTLLTYCGITPDLIPYIAEQNSSLKLGLYTPGTHIPVVDEKRMFEEQPDYGMMLSWHYAKPIAEKLKTRGLQSKIIVPLPTISVLD